ncbi:uncharacterized protein G2W53_025755 [Senna tora]|uniref:Uncharacterized protein n=1 Tax=Senna tora TaxID=362788 RepID=A0A834TGC4_9FABA|nr:uncharacterized protein G2W53_025755 [Senna tora]
MMMTVVGLEERALLQLFDDGTQEYANVIYCDLKKFEGLLIVRFVKVKGDDSAVKMSIIAAA